MVAILKFGAHRCKSIFIVSLSTCSVCFFFSHFSPLLKSNCVHQAHKDFQERNSLALRENLSMDPKRLCFQNQFIDSLSLNITEHASLMDKWIAKRSLHEKLLTEKALRVEGNHFVLPHTHDRFDAFETMGNCTFSCVGGSCRHDQSKIVCGLEAVRSPCVVYSIGGNNQWNFELDVLEKTPCEVHTFDCTGPLERFHVPKNRRLHFHHVCLGTSDLAAPKNPRQEIHGEFWTLEKMKKMCGHSQIDLIKIDIEGKIFQHSKSNGIILS